MPRKKVPEGAALRAAVVESIRGTVTGAPDLLTLVRWIRASETEVAKALRRLIRERRVREDTTKLPQPDGKPVAWTRYRLTPKGEREGSG